VEVVLDLPVLSEGLHISKLHSWEKLTLFFLREYSRTILLIVLHISAFLFLFYVLPSIKIFCFAVLLSSLSDYL